MDEVASQPVSHTIDRDGADAYAEFWHCLDADGPAEPSSDVDPERDAYEQFWNSVDADGWCERERSD